MVRNRAMMPSVMSALTLIAVDAHPLPTAIMMIPGTR